MAFNQGPLHLPTDPLLGFTQWFDEAVAAAVPEPTAMTLATVSKRGQPSARIVLFKGVSQGGFTFVTNYQSRKGQDLLENPRVALVFHWLPLYRQVRIEGIAETMSATESDTYFASRPRGSQIGAWASPQSQTIDSRDDLMRATIQVEERFRDQPVPRPSNWGGYRIRPHRIEFWEERDFRLHERLAYEWDPQQSKWIISRLAP